MKKSKKKYYMITIFDKNGKQVIKKLEDDFYNVVALYEKYPNCPYSIEVIQ